MAKKPATDDPFVTTSGDMPEPGAGTALAVKPEAGTALTLAELGPDPYAELDAGDMSVPVIHLFQDIGKESDQYGSHPKGTWVDSVTRQALVNPIVIPITVKPSCDVWHNRDSKAGKGIVASFRRRAEVPPAYLTNPDMTVMDTQTWFVVLSGAVMPYAIRLKSTGLKAARTLATLEVARRQAGQVRGQYRLESKDESNDKGKWKGPVFAFNGAASPEDVALAAKYFGMFSTRNVVVTDPGSDETANVGDAEAGETVPF